MSEEIEYTEKKFQSRKFLVWFMWLIITVLVIAFCVVTMFCTKTILESMTSLIEKTLGWFFAISMMYLGMNAGQKVGVALADSITTKLDAEEEK